jgi:hypothetical protein
VRRYSVQKCDRLGKNTGAPLEIYADSEIKAAEIATGMKLRQRGRSGEMRARVHVAGQASPPTPFFAARALPPDVAKLNLYGPNSPVSAGRAEGYLATPSDGRRRGV